MPRYLIFGLGAVGAEAARSLIREGADIVGVFTRSSHVGKDLGEVLGLDTCGIRVEASASFRAQPGLADVALFFTTTALTDLLGDAKRCLQAGINVVTISEDAMYPWDSDAAVADELDTAARTGNATLIGTGINEAVMAQVPAMLGGMVHGATRIEVECTGDFGAFGAELLAFLQIGVAPAQFQAANGEGQDAISRQCAHLIAGLVGADVLSETIRLDPTLSQSTLNVAALNQILPPGVVSGTTETTSLTTAGGPDIEVRLIGKIFEPGEEEYACARVFAPALSDPICLRISPLPGVVCTTGIALSRAVDVLSAPPGYLRAGTLPPLRHRSSRGATPHPVRQAAEA